MPLVDVFPYLEGAEVYAPICVRLHQAPAGVKNHVPIGSQFRVLFHEIRQIALGELRRVFSRPVDERARAGRDRHGNKSAGDRY